MGEDCAAWRVGLEVLLGRVADRFFRVEPRRRAGAYVRGLLAPLADKNGWTLAEATGDVTPDGMQRLLNAATWDVEGLRDDVRAYVAQHLGQADGVLIVGETGFLKKGTKSAGVQRQYSGTAGRVENCQLGVFLAYTAGRNRALIDRELYVPTSWITDRDRCRAAGIEDKTEFATKAVLARGMIERALTAEVPATCRGRQFSGRSSCGPGARAGVETPLSWRRGQGPAALRLGRGRTARLRRHHPTGMATAPAGAPPDHQRRYGLRL